MDMDRSGITERLKAWKAAQSVKRQAMQQRLVHIQPFRENLVRCILASTLIVLPVHTVVVIAAGMPATLKNLTGTAFLPAVFVLAAAWCLRSGRRAWRMPLTTGILFAGIVFTAAVPQSVLAAQGGYGHYGGMIVLTILLSGLLIGEFYVGAWTFVCCVSFQFAINYSSGWIFNAGWCAVYVGSAWLVTLFSRHLEQLYETARTAEEQERSAIAAERARFARDIHETLAQGFAGIMAQLDAADRHRGDAAQARPHLQKARQLALDSLDDARRSVSALRSTAPGEGAK
jgi:hypothetical protein